MADIVYITSVLIDSKPRGQPGSEVTLLLSNGDVLGGLLAVEIDRLDPDSVCPVLTLRVQVENPNGEDDDDAAD